MSAFSIARVGTFGKETVSLENSLVFIIGRTDSHSLDTRLTPSTTTTILAIQGRTVRGLSVAHDVYVKPFRRRRQSERV